MSNADADQCRTENGLLNFEERCHLAKTLPKADKQKMVVESYIQSTQFFLKQQGKCLDCAFLKTHCICASLENLATLNIESSQKSLKQQPSTNIRFLIWMHYKERYRASNTGKLLFKIFPGSKCFIHDSPDDYLEFSEIVRNNSASRTSEKSSTEEDDSDAITVVLYPSLDAVDAVDLLRMMKQEAPETGTSKDGSDVPPLGENPLASYKPLSHYQRIDIVLLDGTWTQARKMRRNVRPGSFGKTGHKFDYLIPVKISPTELSRFSCRRQSQVEHISTIEAAAVLIKDLQLDSSSLVASMYSALELLCDTMDRQSHINTMQYIPPTKNGLNRLPKNAHEKAVFAKK